MAPVGRVAGALPAAEGEPPPSGPDGEAACEGLPGPLGDRTLLGLGVGEWRRRAFLAAGAGLDGPDDGEALLLAAGAVASPRALRAVVAAGRAGGGDRRFVPGGRAAGLVEAFRGERAWVAWLAPGGSGPLEARAAAAPTAELPAEEREIPGFTLPDGPLCVADSWVFPVGHWVELLWANLLALGPHLWGALVGGGAWPLVRLPWAAAKTLSLRPEHIAAALVSRGRGSFVHRRAVVEGVVLGEGARIGAGAVVRGSVLGPGAVVEELAIVEGAVLGAGARVQRQALAKYCVIEAGAAHAGIVQLGVVGRDAQVKMGATLMDMGLGQDVLVRVGGEPRRPPHGMCGVCVGPGAVVGSGVRVAPGRVLPPGVAILADPDQVLRRVDLPAGTPRAVVRNGGLEPA